MQLTEQKLHKGTLETDEFPSQNKVNIIGEYAFVNCTSLTEITIPDSLLSIGDGAFARCTDLAKITVLSKTVTINERYSGSNAETLPKGAIIYGYLGSTAQTYAEKYDRTFVGLDAPQYIIGDVDGNKVVDSSDAIYLLYSVMFGEETYPLAQSVDYDGDGRVTSSDAVYLLYHVMFGEEDYPLYIGSSNA